jgi:hypothetical protein
MPTEPDDIAEAAATRAALGVSSVDADGQKTTGLDPEKMLDVADRLERREAVKAGGNSWLRGFRKARIVPPGAGPQ